MRVSTVTNNKREREREGVTEKEREREGAHEVGNKRLAHLPVHRRRRRLSEYVLGCLRLLQSFQVSSLIYLYPRKEARGWAGGGEHLLGASERTTIQATS